MELLGQYRGSGYREAPRLVRCGSRLIELSPLLYLVLEALDGRRSLDQVASVVSARSGRTATAADVEYLLDHKLSPLGLLDGARDLATDGATGRHRGHGSAPFGLSLRAAVVSSATVRRCTGPLQALFHLPVVACVLVGLALVDLWLVRNADLAQALASLTTHPEAILVVAAITVVAAGFHELGHATACRVGGAEPGAIGAGIYLIWPVFYNDLYDSYRLDRAGRLRADLGGVYFNAVAVLALGAAYAATGFGPLVVAIAVQHMVVLYQFLPFARLDGYYVVADLAGVPDLFARIRPVLASLVPGRPTPPAVRQLKPWARGLVTAWALVTVPVLAGLVLLLVVRLPQLAEATGTALHLRGRALGAAWYDGAGWSVALEVLRLALVVVPPVGIAAALARGLRSRLVRGASAGGHRPSHSAGSDGGLPKGGDGPGRALRRPRRSGRGGPAAEEGGDGEQQGRQEREPAG